jgi:hypothetical protein
MMREWRGEKAEWLWSEMDEAERARCRREGVVPRDYPGPVAENWPDLIEIVRRLVKPERDPQKRDAVKRRWWQFAEKRPGLRAAMTSLTKVLAITQTSPHLIVTQLPGGSIYDQKLIVVVDERIALWGACQNRVHEHWARFFGGRTEAASLVYGPSDVFDPFPFPPLDFCALRTTAESYQSQRASLLVSRNEGLTKTYNPFHNPSERAPDIERLRELHHELDLAVLRAYGWEDLAARAAPEFLSEDTEADNRYQGRLFWPAPFRDEVLARLLNLNRARATEERALGLSPGKLDDSEEDQDESA